MVGHKCHSKTGAKRFAHKMRKKGFNASISKGKGKYWNVSITRNK